MIFVNGPASTTESPSHFWFHLSASSLLFFSLNLANGLAAFWFQKSIFQYLRLLGYFPLPSFAVISAISFPLVLHLVCPLIPPGMKVGYLSFFSPFEMHASIITNLRSSWLSAAACSFYDIVFSDSFLISISISSVSLLFKSVLFSFNVFVIVFMFPLSQILTSLFCG